MNNPEQKPDSFAGGGDSQFKQSGFGNSTFGGAGGSTFSSQANSTFGAAGNSKFGGGAPNSEFGASGFGGNSSVSQIFKEGGFGDDGNKKKIIAIVAAAVVAIALAAYFFMGTDGSDDFQIGVPQDGLPMDDFAPPALDAGVGGGLEAAPGGISDLGAGDAGLSAEQEASYLDEPALPEVEEVAPSAQVGAQPSVPAGATGNVSTWDYNEELGGPKVNVTPGAMVEVSRRADFATPYVYGPATDGSFRIPNPPPGVVYWREQGSGTVNEIQVNPPPRLSLTFSAPANMNSGETLSWGSAGAAAYFRVEFSTDPNFQNIAAAVSTTGTQAVIDGLASGTYFVRVGGLNLAAGRFEYSSASSVTVQ
jgi:hypothetical protein